MYSTGEDRLSGVLSKGWLSWIQSKKVEHEVGSCLGAEDG